MEFPALIKKEREKQYNSSKEFHARAGLNVTYFYYSQMEKDRLPELELAITILKALKINLRKGLYTWVRDQMPDKETRAFFTELGDETPRSSEQMSMGRSLVVNRMQAKFLKSDPIYWELVVFISAHHGIHNPNEKEIAARFGVTIPRATSLLEGLYEYGLIEKTNDGRYSSKEWVFIPYDAEYEDLRDTNFNRALDQFKKQQGKKFRTTITRFLTPAQQKEVEAKVLALTNSIVDMEDKNPSDNELVTIGVFASPRRMGEGTSSAALKGARK